MTTNNKNLLATPLEAGVNSSTPYLINNKVVIKVLSLSNVKAIIELETIKLNNLNN